MLKELTIEQFVREVASSSPAPGGGSVAALAGAQAAGLLSMYCNLSQNRNKLGDIVDKLKEAGEEARFLKTKLLEAIDEDTIAFNRVMDAYRLPKDSAERVEERKRAILDAAIAAADVPLQTSRGCLRVLSLVGEVAGKGNPMAITDLGVANLQARAGLTGACYNVLINLETITNQRRAADFKHEIDEITRQGEDFYTSNLRIIENLILKE